MKKWLENTKISHKLRFGFLSITFLGVLIGIVGVIGMTMLLNNEKTTYNDITLGLQYASDAESAFVRVRNKTKDLYIRYSQYGSKDLESYQAEIQKQLMIVDESLSSYSGTISDEQDQTNFDKVNTLFKEYKSGVDTILAAVNAGNTATSVLASMNNMTDMANKTDASFDTLSAYINQISQERMNNDQITAWALIGVVAGVAILAFVGAILLGNRISIMIAQPIEVFAAFAKILAVGDVDVGKVTTEKDRMLAKRKDEIGTLATSFDSVIESTTLMAQQTSRIASGDLTVAVTVRSQEDVLGQSLQQLVEKMHDMVAEIAASANQVDAGAKQVADSSVALSQGATEQASSVEELTASLEEVTAHTTQNAENARRTDELARGIQKDAQTSSDQMKQMLKAMVEINGASDNIGKIIKVIEDIAFQTNILALNAAVEAARAGEHGKGFAVVAEEVRNLAGQSAKAANETSQLIESSMQKVDDGTKIADDTAESLYKIVSGIGQASELIDAIATATNEQAAALEQINQGVMQISDVVQNTAAAAEESAAASEELSGQADSLKLGVSAFTLKQEEPQPEQEDESA